MARVGPQERRLILARKLKRVRPLHRERSAMTDQWSDEQPRDFYKVEK